MQDFTIDGRVIDDAEDVDEDNAADAFRDILLYVAGERHYQRDVRRQIGCVLDGWSVVGCTIEGSE